MKKKPCSALCVIWIVEAAHFLYNSERNFLLHFSFCFFGWRFLGDGEEVVINREKYDSEIVTKDTPGERE